MSDTAFLERSAVTGESGYPGQPDNPEGFSREGPSMRFAPGVIRIPVTPVNRERLRQLRDAELAPWRDAGLAEDGQPAAYLQAPSADREGAAILMVLAGASMAAVLQSAWVASAFVEGWMQFQEWVGYLLP